MAKSKNPKSPQPHKPAPKTVPAPDAALKDTGRLIDYDSLRPVAVASSLLDVVPMHFSAKSSGPLSGYESHSLKHEIRFRGIPMIDSFAENGTVMSSVDFEYEAIEAKSREIICAIHGAFMAIYSLQRNKFDSSPELLSLFAELHGMHHAWPYIRELVGSSASRLGLSGVFLPVWPPPKRLPPSGEYVCLSTQSV